MTRRAPKTPAGEGTGLSHAYLEAHYTATRKLTPRWLYKQIHNVAVPSSGGTAAGWAQRQGKAVPTIVPEGSPEDLKLLNGAPVPSVGTEVAHEINYGELARQMKSMDPGDLAVLLKAIDDAPRDDEDQVTQEPQVDHAPQAAQTDGDPEIANLMTGGGGWDDSLPMMVALEAPDGYAKDLSTANGGTEAGDYHLHLPIAHFAPMGAMDRAKVHQAAYNAAQRHGRFVTTVGGMQKAAIGPTGVDYSSNQEGGGADVGPRPNPANAFPGAASGNPNEEVPPHPSLMTMYDHMQNALNEVGLQGQPVQGWMPHLMYGSAESTAAVASPWENIPMADWPVESLAVHEGPNTVHYPLSGPSQVTPESNNFPSKNLPPTPQGDQYAAAQEVQSQTSGQAPGAPQAPGVTDEMALTRKSEVIITVPILKTDEDQRLVYGPVLIPDQFDSQGDIISKADVEYAAHNFLAQGRQVGTFHKGEPLGDCHVVESYIAPNVVKYEGHKYPAGTWFVVTRVSEAVWPLVKSRQLQSFSIQGFGVREPITDS